MYLREAHYKVRHQLPHCLAWCSFYAFLLCFLRGIIRFIGKNPSIVSNGLDFLFEIRAECKVVRMPAQKHLVGQFTDCYQKGIDITLPALAHDDAIGSIRANELRTKPYSDLMLDKKLVRKVICCIDNCEVVVEE